MVESPIGVAQKQKSFDRSHCLLAAHACCQVVCLLNLRIIPYSHNLRVFVAMKYIEGTE